MTIYKKLLIMLVGAAALASCDILNKKPLDIISDKDVWNDAGLIDSYLVECYYETSVFVNETP